MNNAAGHRPELLEMRARFRELLAINPNHFGNLPESPLPPVVIVSGDTAWEELTCAGLNVARDQLEATVAIKQSAGYGGDLCSAGSQEYVRFYIDSGSGFVDAGLAAFNAHDIQASADCADAPDHPLTYTVTLPFEAPRGFCFAPALPNVRAILSWDVPPPPGSPLWTPVFGNVRDQHVQMQPGLLELGHLVDLVPSAELHKLPPLVAEAAHVHIPLPDPPPVPLTSLAETYAEHGVPAHRFGISDVHTALSGKLDQPALAALGSAWSAAKVELGAAVQGLLATSGNTTYEELDCVGLEYNLDRLVATLRIKRPFGYQGGLCYPGSQEYVAFWVDWDDACAWTYAGTVAVGVHDLPVPADGLAYSAVLPVDLTSVRRPCDQPRVARVRAVLSWAVPPSTTDPDATPYWGNRLDAHVQVRPAGELPEGAGIAVIGGVGIGYIDVFGNGMTTASAVFALGGSAADGWGLGRFCPFGGLILVQGPPDVGSKYRLWARLAGQPATAAVVTNPISVYDTTVSLEKVIYPEVGTGYFDYLPVAKNFDQVLAHWTPPGDALWEIRLETADASEVVTGHTPWYSIQLDNTAPTCHVHLTTITDCHDLPGGTPLHGRFDAQDANFGAFELSTLPLSLGPNQPVPHTGTLPAAPGSPWSLVTSGMEPCGYVIVLQVWDRSIVNSGPDGHNYQQTDVGFCLRS